MVLERLFPGWALARARARAELRRVNAMYEAARPTRTHPRRGSTGSPDSIMDRTQATLRDLTRHLDENHDLAIGVHQEIVNRVVGTGLNIEAMSVQTNGEPARAFNNEIDILYREWSHHPESTTELPHGEMERLVCRSFARDGEVLVHHITGARYPYRGPVPYVVELLEADFLPFDWYSDNPRIVQGVEKDAYNRPLAYHVYKQHPGNITYRGTAGLLTARDVKRVSASMMSHIKSVKRLGQTRGVPILHGCLRRMEDIKEYEDSERIAARTDADNVGVVRNEGVPLGSPSEIGGEDRIQELEMANGMMWTLVNGQSVEIMDSKRPNSGLEAFRDSQVRMVAAGSGTRYSAIAKNYNGTYSAQRQELVESDVDFGRIREYLVGVFYYPMRQRFIDQAILSGALRVPANVDRRSLYWTDFRGPPMPQIDIQKEMNGRQIAQEQGWTSRAQNTRDLGNDPDVVQRQRAMEQERPTETEGEEQGRGAVIPWRV